MLLLHSPPDSLGCVWRPYVWFALPGSVAFVLLPLCLLLFGLSWAGIVFGISAHIFSVFLQANWRFEGPVEVVALVSESFFLAHILEVWASPDMVEFPPPTC